MEMDFGYGQNGSGVDTGSANGGGDNGQVTNLNTGKIDHDVNGLPAENLDGQGGTANNSGKGTDDKNNGDNGNPNTNANPDNDGTKNDNLNNEDNKNKTELAEGTVIEVGEEKYTVDANGNLVDKDNNIFKEAKDVDAWLKEFDKVEDKDDNEISISSIQDAVGVEITDDNDKPIEFENTTEGVKAYIDAVIETSKEEVQEAAINTLYQKYPILNDVLNYYIANGNSLEGFGQVPDRSGIVIDDTNEAQQEAIIRTAWSERGQKGDVESYIQYLKSSGILAATAREELKGLQEADAQYRKELAEEAERKEEERIKELQKYWNGVHDVIKTRKIAGYQIPETIIINRNGQRLSATPEDFFNYIYRVNDKGQSAYMEDLAKETPESRRDDEILRAYLKFVGGNYSNLIDMAINNKEVEKLRLKAKERKKSSIKITNPKPAAKKGIDIDLGYN